MIRVKYNGNHLYTVNSNLLTNQINIYFNRDESDQTDLILKDENEFEHFQTLRKALSDDMSDLDEEGT